MISAVPSHSWNNCQIGDLGATEFSKVHPLSFPDEQFEYYSIPAYQDHKTAELTKGRDILSQKTVIPSRCVLFGKLNPRVEKVWNVKSSGPSRCIASTEWLPIVPKEGIDQDWLYFLMYSQWVMPVAQTLVTGSTPSRQRVDPKSFYEITVPVPGFEEQRAIAGILTLYENAVGHQAEAVRLLGTLKRAAMRTLFTRGLRGEEQKETEIGPVPESWKITAIDDVAVTTQYGLSVRGQASGAYPILRMNCQEDGRVHYRDIQFVDLDSESYKRFRVRPGDLLFNRTNSIELVGRMAIVEDDRSAVFASYLVRLTVDSDRCIPEFLNYFMNWPITQGEIKKLASRAVGQANINATKLRTVSFPLPSIDEQQNIVAVLDAIDRKIDLHRRKRNVLEELFKALLHKLMTGEIRVGELGFPDVFEGVESR